MDAPDQQSSGLMASVHRLGETFLSALRNRIELFSVELQEEKQRLVSAFIFAAAAVCFAFLAIVVITLTVVAFVPEAERPLALLGFSIFYLLLTFIALLSLRKKLRSSMRPFPDTISELKKDLDCLRPRR